MKKSEKPQYAAFGKYLEGLRLEAGIPHQAKLASLIGAKQQTVSRWELGQSRPREVEIPKLAKALNADPIKLAEIAGYRATPAITSFDEPFPVDGLSPESFERFTLQFLQSLYPEAKVHLAGGRGHKQDGLDVEVELPNGDVLSFQCKRVRDFGPAKVRAAIKAHTRKAKKKFILLTRVASPKARLAVRGHKSWDIWDKDDVSLKIRTLPKVEQLRIVDTFFKGQRLALLGETETSVWQTSAEFFAPFLSGGAFTHAWKLVGRTEDLTSLAQAMGDLKKHITFLVAPGGGGKSRLLKQALDEFATASPGTLVRFLSPSGEVTLKALEELGDRAKLIVVDDAHDRTDLKLLLQYAATPKANTRLLLALRPYGFDYLKGQAANYGLLGERISEVILKPLDLDDAISLATQVLESQSGPLDLAKDIAKLTIDCPLATVMGAWVVSKEKKHFELVRTGSEFRSLLMGRFQDVITGEISRKDAGAVKKLLGVIALVQPFAFDDSSFLEACEKVENLNKLEVSRLLRLLIEAGVLFKRGGLYRLSPDLLADYIIEQECIGPEGKSSGYAEAVFDASRDRQLEHVVVNLGKLDWRLANGDPSNSQLLDETWRKLQPVAGQYHDPHMQAVKAVAYYQPGRALTFVQAMMRKGTHLEELPEVLKFVSYSPQYLREVCECLWELGHSDHRETHQHPNHAIRILTELCAVEPNKPLDYNEIVVDFALSLFATRANWGYAHSPLDVLLGIAQTEGHTTSSEAYTISFAPYFVNQAGVAKLRERVREAVIGLLSGDDLKIAARAAQFLQHMLVFPIGTFGVSVTDKMHDQWTPEFCKTLRRIKEVVAEGDLPPIVLLQLARSIAWHGNFAEGETHAIAQEIRELLPTTIEFRSLVALVDPWDRILRRGQETDDPGQWTKQVEVIADELVQAFPTGDALRQFLADRLEDARSAGVQCDAYTLYFGVLARSEALADAVIEDAIRDPHSVSKRFVDAALNNIMRNRPTQVLSIVERLLATTDPDLECSVGLSYGGFDFVQHDTSRKHTLIVRSLLKSPNDRVVDCCLRAIVGIAKRDRREGISILIEAEFARDHKVADNAFLLFHSDGLVPYEALTQADVEALLDKIFPLKDLRGYWVQTFIAHISRSFGRTCARFFMRRVEYAADREDWSFRASIFLPNVRLQFRASPEFVPMLREMSAWLKSRTDRMFQHLGSELFEMMFKPFDNEIVVHLDAWLESADAEDIKLIGSLLREADNEFVFSQRVFVGRFLATAKQYGPKVLEQAMYELYAAATTGMKSGTAGEPFPQDIHMRDAATEVLAKTPRHLPEYDLYEMIKRSAESDIARSLAEAELVKG
jgi:Helix-turn-helix.